MDAPTFLATYGYLAVLAGCFIEGETVLLLAGAAAGMGLLTLPGVIAAAACGAFATDNVAFQAGRLGGPPLVARSPRLARLAPSVHARLARHERRLAFCVRFAIGFRTALPLVMGAGRLSPATFAALDAGAALLWAFLYGGAGYAAGPDLADAVGGVVALVPGPVAVLLFAGTTAAVLWLTLRGFPGSGGR